MRKKARTACVIALLVLSDLSAAPRASAAEAPGFVSVVFGRTQWVSARDTSCSTLPNTVTLGQAHQDLASRGLDGVGVVIVSRTPETGFRCLGGTALYPGWDQLSTWHNDGWAFLSGGTHSDIRTMTYDEQVAETCGSLRAFDEHGISGWGMYAYANNAWSLDAQIDPVSRCFSFGRRYSPFRINQRETTTAPWFQLTHSVNGGKCNDRSLACYRSAGSAPYRYDSPARLAQLMAAEPDTWFSVQFYRFVTGAYQGSSRWKWDCRASDWRRHYTSQSELYCYGDFLRIMDALRDQVASGAVVEAGPAEVGEAWGRIPPESGF